MAKKIDQKAAVLAAAQGSGAVFEALNDDVAMPADAPREEPQTVIDKEEASPMNTHFNPAADMTAATDRMRQIFDGKGVFDGKQVFDAKGMMERSNRIAREAAELARGNVEAMVASSRIAARNASTIGQDVAEFGRKGFEGASEAIKGFTEAKTPAELLRLQGEYAKSYMETMLAETTRLSETMVKLAGEAIEPVQARMSVAAEKAKTLGS